MTADRHFGVYAVVETGTGLLVLIRKSRGPYKGLLDLPGGRPEGNESWEETLARELFEELSICPNRLGQWHSFSLHVDRDSSGEPIDFFHEGVWCRTSITDPPTQILAKEDVAGFELLLLADIGKRKDLSHALQHVISEIRADV